jgi:hypothetical protein
MTVASENILKSVKKTFLLDVEYNFLKYDAVPYGYVRNVYFIMALKPMGRRLIGKPKCRWQGNIKTEECPGRS